MANKNGGDWPPKGYDQMGDEHGRGEEEVREEGSFGKQDGMSWTEYEDRRREVGQDLSQVNKQDEPSVAEGSNQPEQQEPEKDNNPEPEKDNNPEPEKNNNPEPEKSEQEQEPAWTESIGKTSGGRYEQEPEKEETQEPQKEVEEKGKDNEPEPEWTQSIGKTSEGRYDMPEQEKSPEPEPEKEVQDKSKEMNDHDRDI